MEMCWFDRLCYVMETSLLVVRRYNVIEQLEDVSHSEEELQCTEKNNNSKGLDFTILSHRWFSDKLVA